MRKFISILIYICISFLLVSCKDKTNSIKFTESSQIEQTLALTENQDSIQPLGSLTNPISFSKNSENKLISDDGYFCCICDFDDKKEYHVGDIINISATLTNMTDNDLYIGGVKQQIIISKADENVGYVPSDILELLKSGESFTENKEFIPEDIGKYQVYIARDFYVGKTNDNSDCYDNGTFYRLIPCESFVFEVK